MDIQFWMQHSGEIFVASAGISVVTLTTALVLGHRRTRRTKRARKTRKTDDVGFAPWLLGLIGIFAMLAAGVSAGIVRILGNA